TPEILADAAYLVFQKPARSFTGHFLIDDTFLAAEGVTDFEKYRVDAGEPLASTFFVPDEAGPPPRGSVAGEREPWTRCPDTRYAPPAHPPPRLSQAPHPCRPSRAPRSAARDRARACARAVPGPCAHRGAGSGARNDRALPPHGLCHRGARRDAKRGRDRARCRYHHVARKL